MTKHKRRKHGKKRTRRASNPAEPRRRRRRHRRHAGAVHGRRRHVRRRNPGSPVADLLLAIGAGGLAALAAKVIGKEAATVLPSTTPAQVISGGKIALGVLGAALLAKKHPMIAAGVAVGAGAPALLEVVTPYLPTSLQSVAFEGVLPNVPRLPAPRADMSAVDLAAIGWANANA